MRSNVVNINAEYAECHCSPGVIGSSSDMGTTAARRAEKRPLRTLATLVIFMKPGLRGAQQLRR